MSRILIQGVIFLVIASMVAGSGSKARTKRSILVGDSEGWRAGTNYTQWAIKNSPFQINDTLGMYHYKYQLTRSSETSYQKHLFFDTNMTPTHLIIFNHFDFFKLLSKVAVRVHCLRIYIDFFFFFI